MMFDLRTVCFLIGLSFAANCSAADMFGPFDRVEDLPRSELWLSTGIETWHFKNDQGLNSHNPGWGIDYRFSTTTSITGGKFFNSVWQDSNYLGISWHPLAVGPFRFGMFAGLLDGYPRMESGGTFFAAVPAISAEYGRLGANLIVIPSIRDKVYGGISLQLKLKLY